jgi:hypothetical protein
VLSIISILLLLNFIKLYALINYKLKNKTKYYDR